MNTMIKLTDVHKSFIVHTQNGEKLDVLKNLSFEVKAGECLVLDGPSGTGKSTVLKLIYGNYLATRGEILLSPKGSEPLELTTASTRKIIEFRANHMSYVSQFLRVIPRVSSLETVAENLSTNKDKSSTAWLHAIERSKELLSQLNIPKRLWDLPPSTFSGGEQQRINIARNLIKEKPILLLDEPTASLDDTNSKIVISLFLKALDHGASLIGIFHDSQAAKRLATQRLDIHPFKSTNE